MTAGVPASRRHWVWVTRPEHCDELDGAATRDLRWCCARDTREGDLGVVYRSRERRDVSHLVAVRSDAEPDPPAPGSRPACRVEVLARFDRPLPLAEMRADPVLRRWPALRASFVQRCSPVPREVWARILDHVGVTAGEVERIVRDLREGT